MQLFVYILLAIVGGYLLQKCKVPGGMMVGAALACALGNILLELGSIPTLIKVLAQILTGIYIGINVEVNELKNLKNIIKPLLVVTIGLLITNVITGFLITTMTSIDLITAMLAAAAGGVSNMPLIAADMNGNPAIVAIFQCVRMIVGIGIFPSMISYIGEKIEGRVESTSGIQNESTHDLEAKCSDKTYYIDLCIAVVIGTAAGYIGNLFNIPSSYLLLSLLASILYKVYRKKVFAPSSFRKFAQLLSGIYIGSCFNQSNVAMLSDLFVPILVMIVLFVINFILCGFILYKKKYFGLTESLLASTPAGASDMALVTADLGIQNTYLNLLHVMRLLIVISIFPFILNWIALLLS